MPLITPQQQHQQQPSLTYERFDVTPAMKSTLKAYILKQRRKKKEEEEQDAVLHRERKIREAKRQQDTASLEQTKEQIDHLEKKLEGLKKEKHDLFSQLKKVLNQEEEQRRRVQQLQLHLDREKSEVLAKVGVGPLPSNLVLEGMSPPHAFIQKPIPIASSPPGQATVLSPLKRPRSPSPHTTNVVGQTPQTSSGFLSPKRATPPYQRSPYHTTVGSAFFSSRGLVPSAVDSNRFIPPALSSLQQPVVVATPPFPRFPIEVNPRSPQYDVRPVAPQATHLPAKIPQHMSSIPSIPILPQQKQMGSITSGFPLNKSSLNSTIPLGLPASRFNQRAVPPQTFAAHSHQRM